MLSHAPSPSHHTQSPPTSRLIVASNRGPIEHYLTDAGMIRQRQAGGGVAVALRSVAEKTELTWIAAACSFADQVVARTERPVPIGPESSLRLLGLPPEAYEPYYKAFCNPLLWFVQHGIGDDVDEAHRGENALRAWRDGYVAANRAFADAISEEVRRYDNARVMLHDYHLYLAARLIRQANPGVPIQQFVHIPWPEPEAWAAIPACIVRQICLGLLGNDSLAFQDDDSVENFKDTCREYLGSTVRVSRGSHHIEHGDGQTYVWTNPISVDVAELKADVARASSIKDPAPELKTILRVDRLDPSKNALRGFQAYETLLENRPDLRGKVRFIACLVPSRGGVSEYDTYTAATFDAIDRVGSSRVDLQACKLEYSIVSPK